MWAATDPGSGRLSSYRRRSADHFVARIEALLAAGEGYSHVHHVGRQFPLLALSFKGGYGVVHQFRADDTVLLLAGDGVIGALGRWCKISCVTVPWKASGNGRSCERRP